MMAPAPVAAAANPAETPARMTRAPFGDGSCPFAVWVNYSRALVEGYGSTISFRVENEGALPIENAELSISSRGLSGESMMRIRRLAPAAKANLLAEVEVARSGHYVMQVSASWDQAGQHYSYRGQRPLRIYKAPDNSNIVINIGDIQSNTGGGANQALGAEYGDVQISNLIEKGTIKTVNDLLDLELAENFQPIELELNWEESRQAVGGRHVGINLRIPNDFLATAQAATCCTFEPTAGEDSPIPFRLVARREFRLGRGRADSDFIAWLMPRSTNNDERTKRISKVHAVAEAKANEIFLRDNASANGSLFDKHPLDEAGTKLTRQGMLTLGGELEVEFTRHDAAADLDPAISNLRQWSGPSENVAPPIRGAVRFDIIAGQSQPLNALWLLTDAAFGTSRGNALVLDDAALAEVQGRLHHFRGCFWIENIVENSAVKINGRAIRAGDIVPLATGMQVSLGSKTWRVRTDS